MPHLEGMPCGSNIWAHRCQAYFSSCFGEGGGGGQEKQYETPSSNTVELVERITKNKNLTSGKKVTGIEKGGRRGWTPTKIEFNKKFGIFLFRVRFTWE